MTEKNGSNSYGAKEAYQDTNIASSYDTMRFRTLRGRIGNYLDRVALTRVLAQIPRNAKATLSLLDIPCGTGRITRFLLDKGYKVSGADISDEMMQLAAQRVAGHKNFAGFSREDAAHMTFADDSFDCVLSIRFMGHIPDDVRREILSEYRRVSEYAIVEYSIQSKLARVRRILNRFTGNRLPERWSWHTFDKQELLQEIQASGFEVAYMWAKIPLLSNSYYVLLKRAEVRE